jgi:hypothetical protein
VSSAFPVTGLCAYVCVIVAQLPSEADNQDLKWRLQQLQTQYDYTVAKLAALSEGSKHSEVKLEVGELTAFTLLLAR